MEGFNKLGQHHSKVKLDSTGFVKYAECEEFLKIIMKDRLMPFKEMPDDHVFGEALSEDAAEKNTFCEGTQFCGREYLELLASFCGLDSKEIQIRINRYIAKIMDVEKAFFILPNANPLKSQVNVFWDIPLKQNLTFEFEKKMFKKVCNESKNSLFTNDLTAEHRRMLIQRFNLYVKTFIAVPIFTDSEESLVLIGLIDKHLNLSGSTKAENSFFKNTKVNTICDFTEKDVVLLRKIMLNLLDVVEHLICDESMAQMGRRLIKCFKISKEMLLLEEHNARIDALMMKSQALFKAERCAYFFPAGEYLKGRLYYRYHPEKRVITVMLPKDCTTVGFVYSTYKQPLNLSVNDNEVFRQGFNTPDSLKGTIHLLSIPVHKNQSEICAIMEFYNKEGSPFGFDELDVTIINMLSKITFSTLLLRPEPIEKR